MSHFLDSISTIISVFHQHAKEDGDCSNLSRRKMKELIQREFADVIAVSAAARGRALRPRLERRECRISFWRGDDSYDSGMGRLSTKGSSSCVPLR